MPIRMLNFLTQPPPPRTGKGANTPIFKTEEWQDLILTLGAGLKPHEYVAVEFPPDHPIHRHSKHPLEAFHRLALLKIKELRVPYDCYVKQQILYIVGRATGQ
jgi:hypothetical protein